MTSYVPSVKYTEGYSESTEPIDADTDATNCATETSPKKDVQEALILTMTSMDPMIQVKLDKYQKCGNIISQTSLAKLPTRSYART